MAGSLPQSFFHLLKAWCKPLNHALSALFSEEPSQELESNATLRQLPEDIRQPLSMALNRLPNHPSYIEQLKVDFLPMFNGWYEKQDPTRNVWMIVGASVNNLSDIIDEFVEAIADKHTYQGLPVRLIEWPDRPSIASFQQELQQLRNRPTSNRKREIVVIPCLEHCFLRSVDGLDRLDSLKEQFRDDPSRLWIIGLGHIGWKYLKAIYALEACNYETAMLKELSGKQLQEWMYPVFADLEIDFQSSSLTSKLPNKEINWQEKYFEDLADESEGIDTVAIRLFLNSLNSWDDNSEIEQSKTEQADTAASLVDSGEAKIQTESPKRPGLPELDGEEIIYILHSLLIHRTLNRAELAETLGLTIHQIEHQIQTLLRVGVVQQRAKSLQVAPLYYPAVCKKLAGDNLVV